MFPGFPSPFYLPNFFFPFIFPLLHLPLFPFFFYPFFSPFLVTILSHISVIGGFTGWWFGRPSSPSTFSCHKSTATTLSHFSICGFAGSSPHPPSSVTFTLHPKFHDLHFDHQICRGCQAPKYFIPFACKSDQPPFYT
jgi:hypothetical protein